MEFNIRLLVQRAEFRLDIDLCLPDRGVSAIFGPSGSGKTSLLRAIAGLDRPDPGQIIFRDQVWQSAQKFLPPHKRPLGYVFQEPGLFDHLTAGQNLAYGLKRSRNPMTASEQGYITDLLGLSGLLLRYPDQLSGGERQRVALARALFPKPEILLMDEPMAAVDFTRKREILRLLDQVKGSLDIPLLYVSHNIDEVTRLADHLVILDEGKVIQSGPIQQILSGHKILNRLCDEPFSLLFGRVVTTRTSHHLTEVDIGDATLRMPQQNVVKDQDIRLHIAARDVSLTLVRAGQTSVLNILDCHITSIGKASADGQCLIELALGETTLQARISAYSCDQLALAPGQQVFAQIKAVSIVQ